MTSKLPPIRNRLALAILAVCLLVSLQGCSLARTLGTAAFTGAEVSDIRLEGVRTSACIPLFASVEVDPAVSDQQALAAVVNQRSVGCVLGITAVGDLEPRWIFCAAGAMEDRCRSVPPQGHVRVSAKPLGSGLIWIPTALHWQGEP